MSADPKRVRNFKAPLLLLKNSSLALLKTFFTAKISTKQTMFCTARICRACQAKIVCCVILRDRRLSRVISFVNIELLFIGDVDPTPEPPRVFSCRLHDHHSPRGCYPSKWNSPNLFTVPLWFILIWATAFLCEQGKNRDVPLFNSVVWNATKRDTRLYTEIG